MFVDWMRTAYTFEFASVCKQLSLFLISDGNKHINVIRGRIGLFNVVTLCVQVSG